MAIEERLQLSSPDPAVAEAFEFLNDVTGIREGGVRIEALDRASLKPPKKLPSAAARHGLQRLKGQYRRRRCFDAWRYHDIRDFIVSGSRA